MIEVGWSLKEIAAALNAQLVGDAELCIQGVSTDSRCIQPGQLFIALRGENFDGHEFLSKAQQSGAAAAMVEQGWFAEQTEQNLSLPLLVVADCVAGLGVFGALNRRQFSGPVVALTGSNGKTTVKGLTASILAERYQTLSTQGNLNNHLGVPLTLLALGHKHQAAVIELGASAVGEIAYTANLVQPQAAAITNVSGAHLEGFGSIENIMQTKGEIIDAVAADGWVILNLDDEFFPVWEQRAGTRHCLSFSLVEAKAKDADFYATNIKTGVQGMRFRLHSPVGEQDISLNLLGQHNVANALCAAALAHAVGVDLPAIRQGLETFTPVQGRLAIKAGVNQSCLIDDSYNANPASMRAAIDALVAQSKPKHIFVMGAMAELGDDSVEDHRQIGLYAKQQGVEQLFCCGDKCLAAYQAFGEQAYHFSEQAALIEALRPVLDADAVVLIKGSRSSGMEKVVRALEA